MVIGAGKGNGWGPVDCAKTLLVLNAKRTHGQRLRLSIFILCSAKPLKLCGMYSEILDIVQFQPYSLLCIRKNRAQSRKKIRVPDYRSEIMKLRRLVALDQVMQKIMEAGGSE